MCGTTTRPTSCSWCTRPPTSQRATASPWPWSGSARPPGPSSLPAPAFAAVLRRGPAPKGVTGAFLDHERALVSYLAARGVPTTGLEVAWDFTVASTKNITGYAVHIRDVAMAQLHGGSPSFTVSDVSNFTKSQNGSVERMVTGTFSVPSFLDQTGGPYGSVLNLGPDGLPNQLPGNVQTAVFSCTIPQSASAGSAGGTMVNPGRPVLYGVGLFGTATKLTTENVTVMADHYDIVLCATDWEGLTAHDELADGGLFVDLSNFPTLPGPPDPVDDRRPLPRPAHEQPAGVRLEPGLPRHRDAPHRHLQTRSPTTATARGASWAGPSPPSPPSTAGPSSACRAWTTTCSSTAA